MAPDVPANNLMLGHDGAEDYDSDERGDLTRRAYRQDKGKSVNQSTGIQPDEEPVTNKYFEDLVHAILRAVGSRVPKVATSPATQDVPPARGEKQIIPRSEIPEGNRPTHESSGTRSKFQTGDSREERSTVSCYSRSSQGTKHKKKAKKIFDTSWTPKELPKKMRHSQVHLGYLASF